MGDYPHISTLVLICGAALLGAVGSAILKTAGESNSLPLFGLALLTYSVSSGCIFILWQIGLASSFMWVSFVSLLLTLLSVQFVSYLLGEPFNARACLVILAAIAAFMWATSTPVNPTTTSKTSPQTQGEPI